MTVTSKRCRPDPHVLPVWAQLLQLLELSWPRPLLRDGLAMLGDELTVNQHVGFLQRLGLVQATVRHRVGQPVVSRARITHKGRHYISNGEHLLQRIEGLCSEQGLCPPGQAELTDH